MQNSENFYFESDLLKVDDSGQYTYSDWKPEEEYTITFDLKNYMDDLRRNTLNTSYDVIVNSSSGAQIDIYINGIKFESGEIEMPANENITDRIEIKVQPYDASSIELEVQARSKLPYTKTIKADFELVPTVQEKYRVDLLQNENGDYSRLCIFTNEFSGNLKIAYNSTKIKPDTNNSLLRNIEKVKIGSTDYYYIEVNLEKNLNYEIDFVKQIENLILTVGDNIDDYDIVVGY